LLFFNNAKANFNASNRGAVSFVSLWADEFGLKSKVKQKNIKNKVKNN
jgi:hypothetical protein